MPTTLRLPLIAALLFAFLTYPALPARASLFRLAAFGTITLNSSGDSTIPVGTPWMFEVTYDTAAPDFDAPNSTNGVFNNTAAPPALVFFHYRAGTYEVTIDNPAEFGEFSDIHITFTSINAIDINIRAVDQFPPLAQGPVAFHADFNAFDTAPVLSSDALPTNTALSAASFDENAVTLLPSSGVVTSSVVTSLTVTAVPEPDAVALLAMASAISCPAAVRKRQR